MNKKNDVLDNFWYNDRNIVDELLGKMEILEELADNNLIDGNLTNFVINDIIAWYHDVEAFVGCSR